MGGAEVSPLEAAPMKWRMKLAKQVITLRSHLLCLLQQVCLSSLTVQEPGAGAFQGWKVQCHSVYRTP